jgi:hypothetical protein
MSTENMSLMIPDRESIDVQTGLTALPDKTSVQGSLCDASSWMC